MKLIANEDGTLVDEPTVGADGSGPVVVADAYPIIEDSPDAAPVFITASFRVDPFKEE